MRNITEEQIDEIVNKAFLDVTETSAQDFADNYRKYKDALEKEIECLKNNKECATFLYFNLAAIKTAQDNCVDTMRTVLKELLCEQSGSETNGKEGESNVQ